MTRWTEDQLAGYEQKRGWEKPDTLRQPVPEADVLTQCSELLRISNKCAWFARMNTGAWKTEDGGRYVRFGFPGCSDILGQMKDGRVLAFECKREGKKPSEDQQAFLDTVALNNGLSGWGGVVELAELIK